MKFMIHYCRFDAYEYLAIITLLKIFANYQFFEARFIRFVGFLNEIR